VDVAALLRRMERAAAGITAPPLRVRVDAPPRLPPVLVDPEELRAVLLGLAAAARDAMPEGGTLTLGAALDEVAGGAAPHPARLRPGRYVRLSVADTGTGLGGGGQGEAGMAFPAAAGHGQGGEFGLAVASDFAEQAGGGLVREGEAGVGTTVALWLPVAGAGAGAAGSMEAASEG
jgi:signal transduction histidine kinase